MRVRLLRTLSSTLRRRISLLAAMALVASVFGLALPASAATTFSNTSGITVADAACGGTGLGSPYPSSITVPAQGGNITNLTVGLTGVSEATQNDLDLLLVGPAGQKYVLLSDVGNFFSVSNVNLTLDDAAANPLPDTSGSLTSGTFQPTSRNDGIGSDSWPAPAPAGPYTVAAPEGNQTLGTVFNGTNPAGTWSLYATDDSCSSGHGGTISGGWSLNVTVGSPSPTTTTVTSSTNPSATGISATFTAHVAKASDSSNVTVGNVTFKEGSTTLANAVALTASGNASFSTSSLAEGTHVITAFYNGDPSFATSNGSVTQQVDNTTVASDGSYCNTGVLTLNDAQFVGSTGTATPYPSHINVSGASGTISKVTLTAKGVTEPLTDDLDLLLVGPAGQNFVVASDAGGLNAVSNANVTFADDAVSVLADNTGGWGSGTVSSRPVNYNDGTDTFPSPAPSSPLSPSPTGVATFASVFGGDNPNGTWSLYAVDDSASSGSNGSLANGWCLNFTTSNDPATTTTVTSSANPSNAGGSVTFTAHVTKTADNSNVGAGTVTFRSDGNLLGGGPVALGTSGTASVSTSALSEGTHTITAAYSGNPGSFNLSTGSLSQQVDSTTVVSGTSYCNNGGIQINDPAGLGGIGTATPYPSHISVTGTSGNLLKVTATIKGLTHTNTDDVDVLLVSPTGTTLKLMSDSGGFNGITNSNLTFDDAAASLLPDATAISAGTYKPTDYNDGTDSFPSPAPSGPYGTPATAGSATLASFAGDSPNGTWSLYVVDDALGSTGSISGWCLNLTLPPVAADDAYTSAQDTTLTVPAPGVLANDTGVPAPTAVAISAGPTAQGGTVTLNANGGFTYTPAAGFTGTDTFTYTATNGPGSTDAATVTITVEAALSVDAGPDQTVTLASGATLSGSATEPGATVTATWSEESGPGTATFADVHDAGTTVGFGATGVYVLKLTGDDGHRTASDTVQITVDSAPVITVPADITVSETSPGAGAAVSFTVTATGTPTPTIACADGATPVSSGDTFAAGVHTIDCTATNSAGNDSGSFTITVQSGPVITVPADITVTETSPAAGAPVPFTVTADGTPTPSIACVEGATLVSSGDTFAAGVHTIDCTATNSAGSDSGSFTITVRSVPVITVPADFSVPESPQGSGTASVPFTVTATGVPSPTITCAIGTTTVTSPVTLATGNHTIDCTASSSAGSDSKTFTVTVTPADQPPTADAGGPYTIAEGQSLSLDGTGSTDSDGDALTYSWDVNGDGIFGDATGASPTLTWTQLKALGIDDGSTTFTVALEVSDGHVGGTVTSSGAELGVTNTAPTGMINGPADTSLGHAITLNFTATDPSPTDLAAGFDYTVTWGDGTTDGPLHNGSPLTRGHTYAAIGVYTVTMIAADKDGGTSTSVTKTVTVAGVAVVPSACAGGNDLMIGGTSRPDTIGLVPGGSPGSVTVTVNGARKGTFTPTRIVVLGESGNDTITFDNRLAVSRIVYGGTGNDTISGSNGSGVLLGGDGNDTLSSGNGRDILIGGTGADKLNGGSGDDVLVAGTTSYDAPIATAQASLCALQREWTRPDAAYTTRVGHLNGSLPGGLNGSAVLKSGRAARTAFDDTQADRLTGGKGQDWYMLNKAGPGVHDRCDARTAETTTDL